VDRAGNYKAIAIDIDDNGGLIIKLEDGKLRHLTAGEVSLVKAD